MKHIKIHIEVVNPKDPVKAMKDAKKPKSVKNLKDLKSLFSEEHDYLSHGTREVGAIGKTDLINDVTKDTRKEGEQDMTPDDHAEKESKEKRVKNSKNPTIVGRMMK